MPKIHELKIWPEFYKAVVAGTKKCELRCNDRDFKVGDYLVLTEWCHDMEQYTGKSIEVRVTHILEGGRGLGLPNGYVCMSIEEVD